ncbi:hypothetical protein PybrP1_002320 [[Pythium] brassicae (nom. inval.)]|nr:hypothetical protein PybrP1_002320 [[Pythium] brassicae (nom. inval.)]
MVQSTRGGLEAVKASILAMVLLAHPKPTHVVCVFTDASSERWGAAVIQVPREGVRLMLDFQRHQPLAFISGCFRDASLRWPIVEKEAFAIVETCKRLVYLPLRPGGFKTFTDHRNLQYIFNLEAVNSGVTRFQADYLQRWASAHSAFRYEIQHVARERNVCGGILSQWTSAIA